MALFNFRLLSFDELIQWGENTEERHLGCRALGWGDVWINVGDQTLLEYSDDAVARVDMNRYVDYAMETFYGDVIERAQSILTPIPPHLASYMHAPCFLRWEEAWHRWLPPLDKGTDESDRLLDLSIWPWRRKLDLGYLNGLNGIGQPEIYIWTTETKAFIRWQTDTQRIEGVRTWSAMSGEVTLERDQLIHEIQDFHQRYVVAISERARGVRNGELGPIATDLITLEETEDKLRQFSWSEALQPETSTAQWIEMENAMKAIERAALH
jgi:Family of unknown function (DUF5984)